MAGRSTVFVEVPDETFAPVKPVLLPFDLDGANDSAPQLGPHRVGLRGLREAATIVPDNPAALETVP